MGGENVTPLRVLSRQRRPARPSSAFFAARRTSLRKFGVCSSKRLGKQINASVFYGRTYNSVALQLKRCPHRREAAQTQQRYLYGVKASLRGKRRRCQVQRLGTLLQQNRGEEEIRKPRKTFLPPCSAHYADAATPGGALRRPDGNVRPPRRAMLISRATNQRESSPAA